MNFGEPGGLKREPLGRCIEIDPSGANARETSPLRRVRSDINEGGAGAKATSA